MRYFLVPYYAYEEGSYVDTQAVIVRARTKADVEDAIDSETHEGDFPPQLVAAMETDEFGGSSVERAGDGLYYVPGPEDDGETSTFVVRYGKIDSYPSYDDAEHTALRELRVYEPLFYAVDAHGGMHEVKERANKRSTNPVQTLIQNAVRLARKN